MSKATLLFSSPRFFAGMASALDIRGTLTVYNVSETPELADYNAMRSDWEAVGEDIAFAMERWDTMHESTK